jgi:hypothetical protein
MRCNLVKIVVHVVNWVGEEGGEAADLMSKILMMNGSSG